MEEAGKPSVPGLHVVLRMALMRADLQALGVAA